MDLHQTGVVAGDKPTPRTRIETLDALRGIAAISVVLFHYTCSLGNVFPTLRSDFRFQYGHFGVHLFFVISGFVIFMTINHSRSLADFAFARFARLYPAYWTAILLTTTGVALGGATNLSIPPHEVMLNFTMLQKLFGARDVDGVYWTLTRELVFYTAIASLLAFKQLKRTNTIAAFLLLVQAAGSIYLRFHGKDDFGTRQFSDFLLFPFLHLFIAGIALFQIHQDRSNRNAWFLVGATLVAELLLPRADSSVESGTIGHLVVLASIVSVGLVATGRLQWLATRPLLWLGSISYSLYLVHQDLGRTIIWRLTKAGVPLAVAIVLMLLLALLIAHLVRNLVEEPSQVALRTWWRARTQTRNAG